MNTSTTNTNALVTISVLAAYLDNPPLEQLEAATHLEGAQRHAELEAAGDQLRWISREPQHANTAAADDDDDHSYDSADHSHANWLIADALSAVRRSEAQGHATVQLGDTIVRAARRIRTYSADARNNIDITLIADGSPIDVAVGINNLFDHANGAGATADTATKGSN